MTMRQSAGLGGMVGLLVCLLLLTLLWSGVSGVINVWGTETMFVLWPTALMLTVGWSTSTTGVAITILAVILNCITYALIAVALQSILGELRRIERRW